MIRLKDFEVETIKSVIGEFDPKAKIYLFGSRVDSSKKGGDIDLLIISSQLTYDHKNSIRVKLYKKIGEQKIDIVVTDDITRPFVKIALKHGVLL